MGHQDGTIYGGFAAGNDGETVIILCCGKAEAAEQEGESGEDLFHDAKVSKNINYIFAIFAS